MPKNYFGVLGLCLTMLLGACGGGVPAPHRPVDPNGSDSSPNSLTRTNYMVYSMTEVIAQQTKITGISAVDVNDFENTGILDMSGVGGIEFFPVHFQSGIYDDANYMISHYHASHVLYTKSGKIFSIPIYQVNSPKPIQLSKETAPGRICVNDSTRGNDYVDPFNSRLIYKVASAAGQCGMTGEWHMVRQSDNQNSEVRVLPSGIGQIVEAIHDSATAKLLGWLVVENGLLVRYDVDFRTSQVVSLNGQNFVVNEGVELLLRTARKQLVLKMGESIYVYDPNSLTTSSLLNIFQASGGFHIHRYLSDGQFLFLTTKQNGANHTSNIGASKLFSVNLLGEFQVVPLLTENSGIGVINSTNNYLYFTADVDDQWFWGKTLKRISKTGGVEEVLRPAMLTQGVVDMYAQGGSVFIEYSTGDSHFLWALSEFDSQGETFDKYHIVGLTYDHKLNPARDAFDIRYIVTLDQSAGETGELRSISALDRQVVANIGRLTDFRGYWNNELSQFWARGNSYGLFNMYVDGIKKLFFYDAEQSQSLTRIDQANGLTLQPVHQKPKN